ncbi:MAG: dihydroorotate dehydrogenase electron transfer subunit [bacterium]|nr:MAG: dihydroorotate dehydrogenase electron transfer subunit [bacterium]
MMDNEVVPSPKSDFKLLKCKLIDKIWLTPTIIRLRISTKELACFSHPGQFVNIKVSNNFIPLLRRPFSIHRVDQKGEWFEILFQLIGKGTELLANFEINNELDILGPLGNNFIIPQDCDHAVLIAGGLGIAPLLFLAQKLIIQDVPAILFYGNKSQEFFCCVQDFDELGIPYILATEDGSVGFKGKVTDLFLAKQGASRGSHSMIYACGPNPMLQKIKEIANQFNLPCQVSLETMMACGFGACFGCVVNSTSPSDPYKYVCKDGPVFNTSEIDLSE